MISTKGESFFSNEKLQTIMTFESGDVLLIAGNKAPGQGHNS